MLLNWKNHPFGLKLLLSLSGDIHLNPGPSHLCGICEFSVSAAWSPVLSGVPQGSILGPLLFIIHINDLPSTVCSSIKFFADDVVMYHSVHSTGDCDAFQQDLDSIAVWYSKWQMRLNVYKCDLLCISNKHSPSKPSYHINNYNLHWVSSVKYLDVFVDNKLSWNYHVSHVSAKAAKVLNLLRRHIRVFNKIFRLSYG